MRDKMRIFVECEKESSENVRTKKKNTLKKLRIK